jgi:hypothetical protein
MTVLIADTECYPNFWLAAFMRVADGAVVTLELSERSPLDTERLERLVRRNRLITFNGRSYDMPMLWSAIRGETNRGLKTLNDRIIVGRVRWWEVEEVLGFRIPASDHIDLIEPQPNAIASLKTLNGRLHGARMQDLPYAPDHVLSDAQMDEVKAYCVNDLEATRRLYEALAEPLEMRRQISDEIGVDVRSKSDTQVGAAILKTRVERITGNRIGRSWDWGGRTFRYEPPPWLAFEDDHLRAILAQIRDHDFIVKDNGKVDMPRFLADARIVIGPSVFQMGIGGLHSTESHRSLESDAENVLIDADVASYYPAIILNLGLYPPAMGPETLTAYAAIRRERLKAKALRQKARADGLKITLNGFFGQTSNPHTSAYSPEMFIAITITGQLALLMLIERAWRAGIPAVSGNTDGATFLCPRPLAGLIDGGRLFGRGLPQITAAWEKATGFDLEFVRYASLHSASVNTYFAIKEDGSVKRKGLYSNPWADDAVREQLMKNPNMTICSDAALAFIQKGTPVEQTIRACADIRQFVTVVNVRGGGTWRGEYLGRVVRFYWAQDGAPILYKIPHPTTGNFKQVSNTAGSRPMMDLVEDFPLDLDYERYITDAREIVRDLGVDLEPSPGERAAAPPPRAKSSLLPALLLD